MSFCINGCNPSSKNPKIISEKMEKERKRWTNIFVLQDEPPNHCYKASGSVCKSGATRTRSCLIKKIERNANWDRIMGMGLQYTYDQPLGVGVFIKRMELKWWWVSSPLKTTLKTLLDSVSKYNWYPLLSHSILSCNFSSMWTLFPCQWNCYHNFGFKKIN